MLTRRPLLSRDAMVSKLARGWTAQGCARGDWINVRYSARLTVDGTWPMRTELAANLKKRQRSRFLYCTCLQPSRCFSADQHCSHFLRALRREMPVALTEIRRAGVGPTDIHQAAIGAKIGLLHLAALYLGHQ